MTLKSINNIDEKEIRAVTEVLESGSLSGYNASWGEGFRGGSQVQKLERLVEQRFAVNHAIAVNSWSSGLLVAVGSLQLEPGDEIIVSPWNMCSTVTSILQWLCIPVFCDIETETFSIDPDKLEACITDKTRAIILNDMHGRPTDFDRIKTIADKHNLRIISDSAQTIGAVYKNKFSGTLADIGGFSFNWHKHIHCGEGGILITNNDDLALRMRLLINHAEGAVQNTDQALANMIGFNFRLTEIQAAILVEQFKKLDSIIEKRQTCGSLLTEALKKYTDFCSLPVHTVAWSNVYCSYPIVFNNSKIRNSVYNKLVSLGLDVTRRFSRGCVHLLPVFQKQTAFGNTNIPWNLNNNSYDYAEGICPVAEELEQNYFLDLSMEYEYSMSDIKNIKDIFEQEL